MPFSEDRKSELLQENDDVRILRFFFIITLRMLTYFLEEEGKDALYEYAKSPLALGWPQAREALNARIGFFKSREHLSDVDRRRLEHNGLVGPSLQMKWQLLILHLDGDNLQFSLSDLDSFWSSFELDIVEEFKRAVEISIDHNKRGPLDVDRLLPDDVRRSGGLR